MFSKALIVWYYNTSWVVRLTKNIVSFHCLPEAQLRRCKEKNACQKRVQHKLAGKGGEKVFPGKLVLDSKLEILDMLGCEAAWEVFNQASYARVKINIFLIKMSLVPVYPA